MQLITELRTEKKKLLDRNQTLSQQVRLVLYFSCVVFELISIKIGFFTNFKSCFKIGPKYYSTWFLAKMLGENFSFLLHFLMYRRLNNPCNKSFSMIGSVNFVKWVIYAVTPL